MSKLKFQNRIANKIMVAILIAALVGALAFYIFSTVSKKKYDFMIYNLGPREGQFFSNLIITNYEEYLHMEGKYKTGAPISKEDFDKNYILAIFDEYDSCAEKKHKTIESIDYSDGVNITFQVHNKCGFCKKNIILYLIKIKKIDNVENININYVYDNEDSCNKNIEE